MASKKSKLKQKLTNKFRLVVLNEESFEERFSLKLSVLNLFVLSGVFSILVIVFTTLLIAFTPLREYIPGYSSSSLKRKAAKLTFEADSLKLRVAILDNYINALKPVLKGDLKPAAVDSIKKVTSSFLLDESKLNASKTDSLFREKIDSKDRFPLAKETNQKANIVFFAPVNGSFTQKFDAQNKHFAIDIVAKTGTAVKAIADGTVIISEWTAETGYVISLQHANNFISVYKHNGNLLKQQGDFVKSGEVISSVGSTGELTTGPHLHFELWNNGYAVNPTNYIDFQ
ncbi:peptidase M23-like protein [Lutibacter sp. Hel_I_33_5]|uniref:M23 family metallopeptidase n=1 Tax=Lutibacter sp. Hel_I_33_5 TaxID=1566289 RepID=UPI00119EDD2A|nr:M23 family metallopeptidase [Lutibacter sp. Hel_I_33_5]TVZ56257.1 peptidase M23-like protein [Lutibacter sp. Hel_I_33_5]